MCKAALNACWDTETAQRHWTELWRRDQVRRRPLPNRTEFIIFSERDLINDDSSFCSRILLALDLPDCLWYVWFSAANFSKFCGPVCQIPQLTALKCDHCVWESILHLYKLFTNSSRNGIQDQKKEIMMQAVTFFWVILCRRWCWLFFYSHCNMQTTNAENSATMLWIPAILSTTSCNSKSNIVLLDK